MTLARRWTLVIAALVIAGGTMETFLSRAIASYGLRQGGLTYITAIADNARFVLETEREQSRALLRAYLRVTGRGGLPARAAARMKEVMGPRDAREWVWVVLDATGRSIATNAPDCTCAGLENLVDPSADDDAGETLVVSCGDRLAYLTLLPAGESGESGWVGAGPVLSHRFLKRMQRVVQAEVSLFGPDGHVAGTTLARSGEPTPADPGSELVQRGGASREPAIAVLNVGVPDYAGFVPIRADPEPVVERGNRSVRSYVAAMRLPGTHGGVPTVLVIWFPVCVLGKGVTYSTVAMILGTLAICLLLCVAAWRAAVTFSRPLSALVLASHRVADGDFTQRVPSEGARELRDLSASFNAMVSKLSESRERIVQSEKMAAIGQLAGGVAHEVNNPLGVILGFAQGMERRVEEGDPLRLPVTSIAREALRCKSLVQELLTFSRTAKTTTEPVDLNEVVEASALLLESRANLQQISIERDLSSSLPVIEANRNQVQQILMNLGTNALDATAEGGRVTLRTAGLDGDRVRLEVCDTGCGIDPKLRTRVFDPFFTTKAPGKGTGLGLSLVYEIVKHHGGDITVADGPDGVGTAMRVELPVRPPEAAA